jgi:hypothetical protein
MKTGGLPITAKLPVASAAKRQPLPRSSDLYQNPPRNRRTRTVSPRRAGSPPVMAAARSLRFQKTAGQKIGPQDRDLTPL